MPVCRALTNQIHVTIDGYYKPCCAFADHSTAFPVDKFTPQEFINSDFMQSIRKDMEAGWHDGCIGCKNNEESQSFSVRQIYNFHCSESVDIDFLDLNLNNDCNLTCRMCSSLSSSKWETLLNKNHANRNNFNSIIQQLPNIKHVKYQGGEPFITKEISDVLDYVAEHRCDFSFSTNCTVFPLKYLDKLCAARNLYCTFSIDGVGLTNDYIRHGKLWSTIETVFKQWVDWLNSIPVKSFQAINTVVQAYNFHNIEEIENFSKAHNVRWNGQLIQDIPELGINALPEKYVNSVVNAANEKYLANYKYDHTLYQKLKSRTLSHDRLLGVDIKDYNPTLYQALYEIE